MSKNPFQGSRYVNLLRASTNMQDTSTHDQKKVNDAHAHKLGMLHAGDVVLNGVSGSKSFNRKDLVELLERRRIFKNFDVIVVYDSSRLTRAGAQHASSVRRDFAKLGVLILSVMDPIPEGDFKDVVQAVIDTQNLLAAKKTSGFVTRGIYDAVKNGVIEKHGSVPIGIDRLYVDAKGEPKFRLRRIAGGRRRLICEKTGEVLGEWKRNEHPTAVYLLNHGETTRLVPGDPEVLRVIREGFTFHYRDGWGFTRVGRFFVSQGLFPLRAPAWHDSVIRDILLNPVYLGWHYSFQHKCGLYHSANADRPVERNINQAELEEQNRLDVPRERRPVEEMLKVDHSYLKEVITDITVRFAAERAIRSYYADWHLRTKKSGKAEIHNHNNQPRTRYFLRDVLRDKHYDRKFCGLTHGKQGLCRDYICNRRIEMVERAVPLRTTFPAAPLEQAVIRILKEVFSSVEDLQGRVGLIVQRLLAEQPDELERVRLGKLRDDIREKVRSMQRFFSLQELQENADVITDLRSQRENIEHRLALAATSVINPTKLVSDIVASLDSFETALDGDGFERFRMLVNTVCPRIVIDLATFEAEVQVALSARLLLSTNADWRLMCGTSAQEDSGLGITHLNSTLKIANYRLTPLFETTKFRSKRRLCGFTWLRNDDQRPDAPLAA